MASIMNAFGILGFLLSSLYIVSSETNTASTVKLVLSELQKVQDTIGMLQKENMALKDTVGMVQKENSALKYTVGMIQEENKGLKALTLSNGRLILSLEAEINNLKENQICTNVSNCIWPCSFIK